MKYLMLFAMFIGAFSCQKNEQNYTLEKEKIEIPEILSNQDIDRIIIKKLKSTGRFYWEEMSPQIIYSANLVGDTVVSIGYQPSDFQGDIFNDFDLKNEKWSSSKVDLIRFIQNHLEKEGKPHKFLFEDENFPMIYLKTDSYSLLLELLEKNTVSFIEPMGYKFENKDRNEQGCSLGDLGEIVHPDDYEIISPNAKLSWHLKSAKVDKAWQLSQGDNIKICIIDTGVSENQTLLNSEFTSGDSENRTTSKLGTYDPCWWCWWDGPDGPNDQCGHGTSMSGNAVAPRGDKGGPVGVAYKADYLGIRATQDVFLDTWEEQIGVKNALYAAANDADVDIISMSLGIPWHSRTIEYGVKYAYNKGKLIFSAGGSSANFLNWWGVIFPAYMKEIHAVTGIKDGGGFVPCDICHWGKEIEFSIEVERAIDAYRKGVTISMQGYGPHYSGASSTATSTMAGIAALVWSTNPDISREEVIDIMYKASEKWGDRDQDYGYGRINAEAAVLRLKY